MMNPQLQDVLLDKAFAEHFKYCCKYTAQRSARIRKEVTKCKISEDLLIKLQGSNQSSKRKKRSANEVVPSNPKRNALNFP